MMVNKLPFAKLNKNHQIPYQKNINYSL
jgi:hypothetical protein